MRNIRYIIIVIRIKIIILAINFGSSGILSIKKAVITVAIVEIIIEVAKIFLVGILRIIKIIN